MLRSVSCSLTHLGVRNTIVTSSLDETIAAKPDLVVTDLLRRHIAVEDLHHLQQSIGTPHVSSKIPYLADHFLTLCCSSTT